MLEEHGINLMTRKGKTKNIIEPDSIYPRELIFGDEENHQLGLLKSILLESNFKETQIRLQQKGLPKGIVALLHGSPGTGKTEAVLQMARETGREIMKVDISQSKSMWFGESEKIIKKIFTDYYANVKKCKLIPILLFNEADAIISKRREIGSSAVAQTENAIQNIILEELEKFDGIFLAATNLVNNLDTAFERRFLFKIEFRKPDVTIKAQIWKSKLPALSTPECEALASQFDLSGGQIENIIRKSEIYEIIHGLPVDFRHLVEFCEKEFLLKTQRVMIGFHYHRDIL
jgi:SpoVK/Ycf46/Vps4 family AAA+-type ATPase